MHGDGRGPEIEAGRQAGVSVEAALAAGEQQLRLLVAPPSVEGRLDEDWLQRALQGTRSAGEFFVRYDGDPLLELRARSAQHLTRRSLLMAPERLEARALALLAIRLRGWAGPAAALPLIARCLEDGALQLLTEDEREEAYGLAVEPPVRALYAIAGELFGVPSAFWRLVLVRFNRLSFEDRRGLFHWVVRGIDPPDSNGSSEPIPPLPVPGLTLERARSLLADLLSVPEGDSR